MPVYDPDLAEKVQYNVDLHDNIEEWTPIFWKDGQPQRFPSYWSGRGLHYEVGHRAYLALWHREYQ